jgi:small subunit ribosomal protein S20
MAIHKSAKKRIRRTARVTARSKSRLSQMRTLVRKVEEAIASGDAVKAKAALKEAQPKLHRTSSKGILHKKTVARKLSRLSGRIKTIDKK